jgi:hypothetical protein
MCIDQIDRLSAVEPFALAFLSLAEEKRPGV